VDMAQKVHRIMVRRINTEVNSILLSMQDMERSRQQTLQQMWNMQDRHHDHPDDDDDDRTYDRRRN